MPIETPCTKICTLHPTLQICIGCGRDLTEIEKAIFFSKTAYERAAVMNTARERLALMSRTPQA